MTGLIYLPEVEGPRWPNIIRQKHLGTAPAYNALGVEVSNAGGLLVLNIRSQQKSAPCRAEEKVPLAMPATIAAMNISKNMVLIQPPAHQQHVYKEMKSHVEEAGQCQLWEGGDDNSSTGKQTYFTTTVTWVLMPGYSTINWSAFIPTRLEFIYSLLNKIWPMVYLGLFCCKAAGKRPHKIEPQYY